MYNAFYVKKIMLSIHYLGSMYSIVRSLFPFFCYHYQILVFSIAARNASIEILLLVSVPDSDSKS